MNSLSILTRRIGVVAARRALPVLGTQTNLAAFRFKSTAPQKSFAVEAPDGTPDDFVAGERHLVDELIADTAATEDTEKIMKQHAMEAEARKTFAVDSPDGIPDDLIQAEMQGVRETINYKRSPMEAAADTEARKTFAVDSPDGTSDDLIKEDMHGVEEIIDYAAEHEDVEKVKKEHVYEDAVKQDRARDPEHDW